MLSLVVSCYHDIRCFIRRLSHSVKGWLDKNNSKPVTGPDVELTLDTSPIINALGNMHFTELKGEFSDS